MTCFGIIKYMTIGDSCLGEISVQLILFLLIRQGDKILATWSPQFLPLSTYGA